ncbi:hypothetical protein BH09CHL1_BH09CHL1_25880 [soil metagenome]
MSSISASSENQHTTEISADTRHWRNTYRNDGWAMLLVMLVSLTIITYLWVYDMWMGRIDLLQQLVPYYGCLGEQLRAFNIPGWNPHQLSGMPFAADPLSGWTQWPAMVIFTAVTSPATAMKLLVSFNLIYAALSTYIYGRVMGLAIPSSIAAASMYGGGTIFVTFNSYCCNIMGNYATWVPTALLGIELAARCKRPLGRLSGALLGGIGLSQMLGAWTGQGTYYAVLLVGAYGVYRLLISPPNRLDLRDRALNLVRSGAVLALSGFGLAAAGLLPRLDISRITDLDGGNYKNLVGATAEPGWRMDQALNNLLNADFISRRVYIGTAIVVLAMLAPALVRRKFAAPFFLAVSFFAFNLILLSSWFNEPFFLIPGFENLHTHSSYRILGAALIAPVMLAAATIDRLVRGEYGPRSLIAVPIPAIIYVLIVRPYLNDHKAWLPFQVWFVLLVTTAIVGGIMVVHIASTMEIGKRFQLERVNKWMLLAAPWVFIVLLLSDSTGKDILEALRGTSNSSTYRSYLRNQDVYDQRELVYTQCSDVEGAGEFLQSVEAGGTNPVRYFGFNTIDLRWQGHAGDPYHEQMRTPQEQAMLTGTRATCLNLYDIQGYSPMQIQRYVDYLVAINGVRLNYHDATILSPGIESPLLALLNPQYIITPYEITADRPELQYVQANMTQVYNNDLIRVFENPNALPHAWITHDVQTMPKDQILPALQDGSIDPRQTALVEEIAPAVQPATGTGESVTFTSYEPDEMSMDVTANSDGFLVLSEVYASGWNAFVDGKQVDIYATDYVLRGIPVSAGTHTVELRYELRSLTIGFWISIVTGFVVLAFLILNAWQLRTKREIRWLNNLA